MRDTTNNGKTLKGNERFIYASGYIPQDLAEAIQRTRKHALECKQCSLAIKTGHGNLCPIGRNA